jgi:hypothetical protein
MADVMAPLVMRVALSADWPEGYVYLRAADGWPLTALALAVELGDDILGKRGWLGRRVALCQLAAVFAEAGQDDLSRAAKLLGTDPMHPKLCREAARMLAGEFAKHCMGDNVGAVISGWDALADEWWVDENDPIKAARAAQEASTKFLMTRRRTVAATSAASRSHACRSALLADDVDIDAIVDGPGVVMLTEVGGAQGTLWGRGAVSVSTDISGRRLPLVCAPDSVRRMRATLNQILACSR